MSKQDDERMQQRLVLLISTPAETFLISQEIAAARHGRQHLHAGPGRVDRHLRLEWALDELAETMTGSTRRAAPPQRAGERPDLGRWRSPRATSSRPIGAGPSGSAGTGAIRTPARPARRRLARSAMGVATATYPYYRMPGRRRAHPAHRRRARRRADGSHEMGMGTATVQAQHAAERLGLPLEQVRFELRRHRPAERHAWPAAPRRPPRSWPRSRRQARSWSSELLKLAGNDSPLARSRGPTRSRSRDGGLRSRDDAGAVRDLCLHSAPRRHERGRVRGARRRADGEREYSMHSYGAQFCEVRVNAVTGETRVSRWLGSFDTGRILNPKTAASQFRGGIIMGLGLALTEETLFDERTGRIMNPSLAEYHVPVHLDVPEIDVIWTDIPDPHSPLGVHGIGEIGITGVGAAVANAVYNATGKRVREPADHARQADLTAGLGTPLAAGGPRPLSTIAILPPCSANTHAPQVSVPEHSSTAVPVASDAAASFGADAGFIKAVTSGDGQVLLPHRSTYRSKAHHFLRVSAPRNPHPYVGFCGQPAGESSNSCWRP